ncbi:MAG TPA: cation transporter [Burkholderiaceae bacterium]|jgi:Co/Zn/Cd efflux system component|nr:cation transporter [Burkholderiaceae bacterium]
MAGQQHDHSHGHGPDHDHDHEHVTGDPADPRYRRVLWWALLINAALFFIELAGAVGADSVSLLADAIDFAGDALNYGLSLMALAMGLVWRSRVAWLKGVTMLVWGLAVLARAGWMAWDGTLPRAETMGAVAILAFAANLGVAFMLYAYREGDANMRSVWLCTRNDAIGNVAVMLAAAGVFATSSAWPDLIVAAGMALLAVSAGREVLKRAGHEMRSAPPPHEH